MDWSCEQIVQWFKTFIDDNSILTCMDSNNVEVPLTSVPDLLKKGHSQDLFIRCVCILFKNYCIKHSYNFILDSSCLPYVFESFWYC